MEPASRQCTLSAGEVDAQRTFPGVYLAPGSQIDSKACPALWNHGVANSPLNIWPVTLLAVISVR